ncbi:hypothetical protein [Flavobacterium terrigena]|uniref:Microcystin-dependent protein n=1 Tax=Flavobacterium terrigena TaxID=402734 RepID=A0A1H6QMI9_9FLAO|nr:hypothetical protein [Flavobacterium terrigena]SEI43176.1 hypothetical protein SAMN05660918_0532 [Flavobacterium terrigena]
MNKIIIFVCLITFSTFGQVGINTENPNSDSYLELSSTDKGLLIPRLDLVALNNPSPLSSHVAGMIVYNTVSRGTTENIVYPGLYINSGVSWERLEPNTTQIGEVKHSFATADHNGWYLLNGRAKASLSVTAQSAATTIGYGATIPDATNRFLKTINTAEPIATQGGSNTFTISQAQLPNVNFLGSTTSDGGHTHQIDSFQGNQNVGLLSTSALTVSTIHKVAENDNIATTNRTTSTTTAHTHTVTVNSGGTGAPVTRVPAYLSTNVFVYLGL